MLARLSQRVGQTTPLRDEAQTAFNDVAAFVPGHIDQ
ncbi:hypothetical protein ACVWWN_001938 [Mycobacterium sp. URHB0021]|jgi:hypothetical protein